MSTHGWVVVAIGLGAVWGCGKSDGQASNGAPDQMNAETWEDRHGETGRFDDGDGTAADVEPDVVECDFACPVYIVPECMDQTCSGHGVCSLVGDEPFCECETGWANQGPLACEPMAYGRWCTADGWCYEYPRMLAGGGPIVVPQPGEIWGFGWPGHLLHGSVQGGSVGRWVSDEYGPTISDATILASGEIVAVGHNGEVGTFDGTAWSLTKAPRAGYLHSVTGTAGNDLWVEYSESVSGRDVGGTWSEGRCLHWDGLVWHEHMAPAGLDLIRLRAAKDGTLFLVGARSKGGSEEELPTHKSELYRWNGEGWSGLLSGDTAVPGRAFDIWATSAQDVWMVLRDNRQDADRSWNTFAASRLVHWDGSAVTEVLEQEGMAATSLFVSGPTDIWFAGFDGFAWHWDGQKVKRYTLSSAPPGQPMWLAGTGPNDVWASDGAGRGLFHWDGTTWKNLNPSAFTAVFAATGCSSPSCMWAVGTPAKHDWCGSADAKFWNGTEWSPIPYGQQWQPRAVLAFAPDIASVAGMESTCSGRSKTLVARWDGERWNREPTPPAEGLAGLWGASPEDLWALWPGGMGGEDPKPAFAMRRLAGTWSIAHEFELGTMLFGLWGVDADNIWAWGSVGPQAVAFRWDGAEWTRSTISDSGTVQGIHGVNADDVWAIVIWRSTGSYREARVYHWDGTTWTQEVSPPTSYALSILAESADSVWVGGNEFVYHWDGETWTREFTGIVASALSVVGTELWAMGGGTLVRRKLDLP